MAGSGSQWQSFKSAWEARNAIAQQSGIPESAVKGVMANDYQNVLAGGFEMSNQNAYADMQAVAQHKVTAPDPAGNGNIATNAMNDVRSIMTGIFHMPGQIAHVANDVGKAAVSDIIHPSDASILGGTPQNSFQQGQQSANSKAIHDVMSLLPGVADVQGIHKQGVGYIEQHPLLSVLDLAGVSKVTRDLTATATGARSAAMDAAEVTRQQAIKDGFDPGPSAIPVPNLSDTSKKVTFSNVMLAKHPMTELAQRAVKGIPTLDSTAKKLFDPWGLYSNSDLVRGKNRLEQLGNADFSRVGSQLAEAALKFKNEPDKIREMWNLAQSGRSFDDIMNDDTIDPKVRDAVAGYEHMVDQYNKVALDSGTRVVISKPSDPSKQAIVASNSQGANIMRQYDTVTSRYSKSMQAVVKKQQDFIAYSTKLKGKYWDPPVGSAIQGKLDAPSFIDSLRQTVASKNPAEHLAMPIDASRDSVRSASKRFSQLFSDKGPVAKLGIALKSGDEDQITRAMSAVSDRLTSKFTKDNPLVGQLQNFIKEYRDAEKYTKSPSIRSQIAKAQKTLNGHGKELNKLNQTIDAKWNAMTADKYEEIIGGIMGNHITDLVKKYKTTLSSGRELTVPAIPMQENELDGVLNLLQSGNLYPTGIRTFIDDKMFNTIRTDAIASYDKLVQSGAKVFWVPKVKENEYLGTVRVGADHTPSERATHERAINMSYSIQNPYLGLAKVWQEHLSRQYTDKFFEQYIQPRLVPSGQIDKNTEDSWLALKAANDADGKPTTSYKEYHAHMTGKEWQVYNHSQFMHPDSRYVRPGTQQMYISKTDLALLRHMGHTSGQMGKTWDASINLFRHAVLTVSPRFAAHMILGTAFLTLGKTGPTLFKYLGEAHTMITEGKFPPGMSRGTGFEGNIIKDIYDPVNFHQVLGGRTMARLFIDSITNRLHLDKVSGAAHAWHHFLETWTDHYRTMAYLYGKDHFNKEGGDFQLNEAELSDAQRLGITPSEYSGVVLANKVMADTLNRTPLENSIIRMIMPFGGWTHHVLRYVMQFPLDHPLRTNFLSNLGEQAYNSDNTGLPEYLFHLMFLGHPDANGNVTAIDFRQWNPLRDVANYMTTAGWVSQMNPLAEGILQGMGINSATGQPELYPQLQYSSFYGSDQAASQTGRGVQAMVQAYIPESSLLDHFFKLSSATKSLARYNPQAYKNQLWQSLNFPWAPQQINTDQILAKQQSDRLGVLKGMATAALQNNDISYLNNLDGPFPYGGWYFNKSQIEDIIKSANQWSKQTGIDVPASDLLQLPSAPTIPIGVTPPASIASTQTA